MSTAPARRFNPLAILAPSVAVESVTISRDTMPGHYIARAVILDLQPAQLVAAIMAVEDRIRETHPLARRSGFRASSDSLFLYFFAWSVEAAQDWNAA